MGIPKYSPYFGLLNLAGCFIQFRMAERMPQQCNLEQT